MLKPRKSDTRCRDAGSSSAPAAAAPGAQRQLERAVFAQLALITGGLAPDDYARAWWDWYLHVASEPESQLAIARSALEKTLDSWRFALEAATGKPLEPQRDNPEFGDPAWSTWPFNIYARAYYNWASWWEEALHDRSDIPERSARMMSFMGRQMLDATSPANFLHTNPELLEKTRLESGQNLVRGLHNWLADVERMLRGDRPISAERFEIGKQVAATPGKVVFRNRLIELIQYSAQTKSVYAEPILIVPAWIMKYYILDLSARNSLVRYLVEQGHTVFAISWKNPTAADHDLSLDDYAQLGFQEAIKAVRAIVSNPNVHTVGYCIGGTLLLIAAAALATAGNPPLASLTLLASLADFSEPGELSVFISPSQLAMLEGVMRSAGVLSSERMAAAFNLLHSRALLWMPAVDTYIRGVRPEPNDLMAWNANGTRMPLQMHSEYLDRLYLRNELARGELTSAGRHVDLAKLQMPMFVIGTETDHVAPWQAVYKIRGLTQSCDYTFLLTSGGHNGGIVAGPANPRRRYRMLTWSNPVDTLSPEEWSQRAPSSPGSWWPAWQQWLVAHSTRERTPAPSLGNAEQGYPALEDAPGCYVHE